MARKFSELNQFKESDKSLKLELGINVMSLFGTCVLLVVY